MNGSRIILLIIIICALCLLSDRYSSRLQNKYSDTDIVQDIEVEYDNSNQLDLSTYADLQKYNRNSSTENYPLEEFQANGLDNPVIDQGTHENGYALLNPPLTAGGRDTMSDRLVMHQVSTMEYLALVTEIKTAISNKIIDYAKTCQEMHGPVAKQGPMVGPSNYPAILHDGTQGLTLACVTDPYDLKNKIIDDVYEIIYKYIKSKFNININAYAVYHDLNMHLNLLEGIIYPLQFSGLYTVHGVQYTNERWIRDKVQSDINVKDVLITTLSRRNIELEVDTDRHNH